MAKSKLQSNLNHNLITCGYLILLPDDDLILEIQFGTDMKFSAI